jgi:hypothetical protein
MCALKLLRTITTRVRKDSSQETVIIVNDGSNAELAFHSKKGGGESALFQMPEIDSTALHSRNTKQWQSLK